jgi:hypothetical protein
MKTSSIRIGALCAAAIILSACASSVPEAESEKVFGYQSQIEAASGYASQQTLIASLVPELKSSAAACGAFKSASQPLVSQCLRVSAVAYYLLAKSSNAGDAQTAARAGMEEVRAASASVCMPSVTDQTTAANCEVIKSYTALLDTRLLTSSIQSEAQAASREPGSLVATFIDLDDAIKRDWAGSRTSIQASEHEKMACSIYSADADLQLRLSGGEEWPAIKNASNGALVQASKALQLEVCPEGSADCDPAICEREPDGVACQRQRLYALGLLCQAGRTG